MPINHDPVTEQELAAKAIAPRVTEADLEATIASAFYFTAAHGVIGAVERNERDEATAKLHESPLSLLTLCVLVLRNGYTIVGHSACASAANFDAGVGQRVARADAVRQLWPLLGYQLRDRLANADDMGAAVASLMIAAETCENNAPIHDADGNREQGALSRGNAASYRAAIARLVP